MGFLVRLSRLFRSNLNELIRRAEDPAKILDQSVNDMQEDLVRLRRAVTDAIGSQKRLESKAQQADTQVKVWLERAKLAVSNKDDELAREALIRKKNFQESLLSITSQLSAYEAQVVKMKNNLIALESKISEAKTKKDMLKARANAARAQQHLESAVGGLEIDSSMAAFERMEEKVEALEAAGEAAAELAGSDLESRFLALEGLNEIDDELESLKSGLTSSENLVLPSSKTELVNNNNINNSIDVQAVKIEEINAELEEMKRSINE